MNKNYCYLNGEFLLYQDMNLHISDLQFQRGYGIFDFFRCRNGEIPWLGDYTERLFNSMLLSGIESPMDKAEFTSLIHELQRKNGNENVAFKVLVTGGYSDTLESVSGNANFIILSVPWRKPAPEAYTNGVNLITSKYVRPDPEIKTLFYFNLLKLHRKMQDHQAVDVLYHNEHITEASRANVFFVKNGSIYTPASNILKGVTRKQILGMFDEIKLADIAFDQLHDFDEMFLCSTSRDINPVISVDGKRIGNGKPGKVTKDFLEAFRAKGW